MTWKLYALLSGGAFVATYLVSGQPGSWSTVQRAQARPVAAAPAVQSTAEDEIQDLANRLATHARDAANYRSPSRNPFEFGAPRHAAPKPVIPPKLPEAPIVVLPPPPPPINLSGIAANHVDGVLQRTAIFSTANGVLLAREGETVLGGYRVVTIDENAVTLEATSDGSSLRLSLTRP